MRQDASIERTNPVSPDSRRVCSALDAGVSSSALDARGASAIEAALASRAFWKELCETVGDLMFETDRAGRFVFLAPFDILGYQAHDLIGHLASDIICGWDRAGGTIINPFLAARNVRMQHVWLRKQDGSASLVSIAARPTNGGGMRGIGIDVTSEDDTTGASVKAVLFKATLDRILGRMREEILTPRMVRAGLGELVDCLGAEGASIVLSPSRDPCVPLYTVGDGWDDVAPHLDVSPEAGSGPDVCARTLAVAVAVAARHLLVCSNRTRFGPPSALVVWRKNDRSEWCSDESRLATALASELRGVLEQDRIQREMTDQSRTDLLTGLLSRRSFLEETRRRFDRLDRNAEPGTLLSIDIDSLGLLNDIQGQDRGDDAIRHVAAVLRDTFRPTDLVCRMAGDEFAVWLDGADNFAAAERAEFLCREGATILFDGIPCRLGFSIGLACRPAKSLEDLESLCRRASLAMMHAKRSGKGVWRASQPEIET